MSEIITQLPELYSSRTDEELYQNIKFDNKRKVENEYNEILRKENIYSTFRDDVVELKRELLRRFDDLIQKSHIIKNICGFKICHDSTKCILYEANITPEECAECREAIQNVRYSKNPELEESRLSLPCLMCKKFDDLNCEKYLEAKRKIKSLPKNSSEWQFKSLCIELSCLLESELKKIKDSIELINSGHIKRPGSPPIDMQAKNYMNLYDTTFGYQRGSHIPVGYVPGRQEAIQKKIENIYILAMKYMTDKIYFYRDFIEKIYLHVDQIKEVYNLYPEYLKYMYKHKRLSEERFDALRKLYESARDKINFIHSESLHILEIINEAIRRKDFTLDPLQRKVYIIGDILNKNEQYIKNFIEEYKQMQTHLPKIEHQDELIKWAKKSKKSFNIIKKLLTFRKKGAGFDDLQRIILMIITIVVIIIIIFYVIKYIRDAYRKKHNEEFQNYYIIPRPHNIHP